MGSRWISVLVPGGLLCAALCSSAGTAQLPDTAWTGGGIPMCSKSSTQSMPVIISDGAGGAITAWEDDRFVSLAIVAQRLTGTGIVAAGWPDSGLAVANTTTGFDPSIAQDGAGGALLISADVTLVVFKHVAADGSVLSSTALLTGADGTRVPGTFAAKKLQEKRTPMVIADGSGGAFAAWSSANIIGGYIEIQRLTAQGLAAPGWPQPRIIDNSYFYASQPLLCPDGAGGVLLAWLDDATQLRIVRMTALGFFAAGWDSLPAGVVISPSPNPQASPGMVSDGAGGAIVFWSEARGGGGAQLFAQRITGSGTIASGWPAAGLLVCAQSTVAGAVRRGRIGPVTYTTAVSDGAGGAFVTWSDQRADGGDVYAQHIQSDGGIAPGWVGDGVAVCTAPGLQAHPDLAAASDGILVVWEDQRGGGTSDIYAMRITPTGAASTQWPNDGAAMCAETHDQRLPRIVSDGELGAIVTWEDDRGSTSRVYAGRISRDGVVGVEMSLISAEVGDGFARLAWYVNAPTGTPVTVERRAGDGVWRTLTTEPVSASGEVVFEDRDVVAGARYGYRIAAPDPAGLRYSAETSLEIPLGPVLELANIMPNPSAGEVAIEFTLPDAQPARIEIVDVGGRLLVSRDVAPLGRGRHVLTRVTDRGLPTGLYFARLRHGSFTRLRKFVVVR